MKVKICGVTRPEDAAQIAAAGADFIGLNFWSQSKRHVDVERAVAVAAAARGAGAAKIVGVFVDAAGGAIAAAHKRVGLDVIQLHGAETPKQASVVAHGARRPVWKAIAIGGPGDLDRLEIWQVDAILLDTPTPEMGGSGQSFDWSLARVARLRHPARQILLAGGLHPGNVADAIAAVQPWGVDVASGVEDSPGIKDPAKVTAFIAAAREAGAREPVG